MQENSTADKYLEFVNHGGNLIVLNTNNNTEGKFSNLFSIQPSKSLNFDRIGSLKMSQSLRVSGAINNLILKSPDLIVKSFYLNNNQIVAPFIIEKKYGEGKIILVNGYGYFGAISKSPDKLFSSLTDIPGLVDLNQDKYTKTNPINAIPPTRFIGEARADGITTINTSSILGTASYYFNVKELLYNSDRNISNYQQNLKNSILKNILLKDIRLFGPIKISINSNGFLYSPSSLRPLYDYIPISFPTGFNMTLELLDGASAEFMINNYSQPIRVFSGKIQMHEIKADLPDMKYISVQVKNPQVNIHGNASFNEFYSNDPNDPTQSWANGDILKLQGNLITEFDHVDNYNNASGTQYVTYLKQVHMDGYTNIGHEGLRIPGDISTYAKENGIELPWKEIMFSTVNAKVLATIVIATIACILILWPRIKKINEIET